MRSILRHMGSQPTALLFEHPTERYAWLAEKESVGLWPDKSRRLEEPVAAADGILVVDTCSYSQLEPAADWLRSTRNSGECSILAIDHHITRDDLADEYLVDESAGAACLILYELAAACGWELTNTAIHGLFVGIATDCGWFRFSNTDTRMLDAAAKLVRSGAAPDQIYCRLFEAEPARRLRLIGAALENLELYDSDRVAVIPLTRKMYERSGATPADTENLINEPMRIGSVEVAVLLAEPLDDPSAPIKVSLRSKGAVNVATLAARLGGGGHARAAGARIPGTLSAAKEQILAAIMNEPT